MEEREPTAGLGAPLSEGAEDDSWGENSGDEDQRDIERRIRAVSINLQNVHLSAIDNAAEARQEEELAPAIAEVIDLTGARTRRAVKSKPRNIRNRSIREPNCSLEQLKHMNMLLTRGTAVQIKLQEGLYKIGFIIIQDIIETPEGVRLRGMPFTRTRHLRGMLPRLRNEVCMVLELDDDDERRPEEQAPIDISIGEVEAIRNIHFTNADFPENRFAWEVYGNVRDVEAHGMLICRWKFTRRYKSSAERQKPSKTPSEFIIEHLRHRDIPKRRFQVMDLTRLNKWRGGKVPGGTYTPQDIFREAEVTVDLEDRNQPLDSAGWTTAEPGQKYTFGDMFCGAGGASCGARKAGFHVKMGCDMAKAACATYRAAFPEATLFEMDIADFINYIPDENFRVDVLHISPPCQYWSPAHTIEGKNDEANIAVLFCCHFLVKKLRPRILTVEQTFGILHPRFEHYFNALIHGFTQYGYSVRWKVENLTNWGLPTQRKRLIMFGTCPGEELLPFPPPTHAASPARGDGRRKFTKIRDFMHKIPRGAERWDPLHNLATVAPRAAPRYDPDTTLARAITCNGGYGNYHYSGRRDFTVREYAVLQTFPADYPFREGEYKRQIGNAFPPLVVKAIYNHIRLWLQSRDLTHSDWSTDPQDDPDEPCVMLVNSEGEDGDEGAEAGGCGVKGDEDGDSDMEITGMRFKTDDSDLEITGIKLRRKRRATGGAEGESDGASDDTAMSDRDDDAPGLCIDGNQLLTRAHIDLTRSSMDLGGGHVDLTQE
ncbi:S-adenosyl-L-methionine-dependent methyltransferase [Xylariaceae sp. FL0016]|nr:S-adenosyl-L-methionine-dependent methyltransferase [Xylariaceae sp. FL0016]